MNINKCNIFDWNNDIYDLENTEQFKRNIFATKDEKNWEMISRKYIVLENVSEKWYEEYKQYVINIYNSDQEYLNKNIEIFKINYSRGYLPQEYYHHLIHNIIYLICCLMKDNIFLDSFINFYKNDIDINYEIQVSDIDNKQTREQNERAKYDFLYMGYCDGKHGFLVSGNILNRALDQNFLMCACKENNSIDIVKYLIEDCKINTDYRNNCDMNCLHYALINSQYGPDIDIITYLIDALTLDVTFIDKKGCTYLMYLCWNKKVDIKCIQFLIKRDVDLFHKSKKNGYCFSVLLKFSQNSEIIKYILELTNVDSVKYTTNDYYEIKNDVFKEIIDNCAINAMHDYECFNKLNFLLKIGLERCDKIPYNLSKDNTMKIIKSMNPLLLHIDLQKIINIDPFQFNYNEFTKYVDELEIEIPIIYREDIEISNMKLKQEVSRFSNTNYLIQTINELKEQQTILENKINLNINKIKLKHIDHRKQNELLFIINDNSYYGNSEIVYDSMSFDENHNGKSIVLNVKVSENIINLYLDAIYFEHFDINNINPSDIDQFIAFIDQYPSKVLSIPMLEKNLINYFNTNNIKLQESTINTLTSHLLNFMYLYIHNLKFKI